MKQRRPVSIFFTAVLLIVLYFALFPYPLGKELVAKPAWAVNIALPPSNSSVSGASQNLAGAAPFRLGDMFGYVDPEGTLLHVGQRLFQVALSQAGYINYARMGTDWIMRNPRGDRIASFSGNGYPLLSEDGNRVIVVSTDLTGLKELDKSGDVAWSRDFPAIMTSLSLRGDFLAVGLLNGTLQLLGRNGNPLYQAPPGQSRIQATYGCAVARDGSCVASVSGISPQVLTVLSRSGSTYSRALRITLPTDYRREVRIGFSPDSLYLFYEGADAVGLVEPSARWIRSIPLPGTLAGSAFLGRSRTAAFAARDGQKVNLRLVAPFLEPVSSESFPASDLFLGAIDGHLLVGVNSRLLRIDVEAL